MTIQSEMADAYRCIFGSVIDNPLFAPGYGPVSVHDKLPKSSARINADSYAYYALVNRRLTLPSIEAGSIEADR